MNKPDPLAAMPDESRPLQELDQSGEADQNPSEPPKQPKSRGQLAMKAFSLALTLFCLGAIIWFVNAHLDDFKSLWTRQPIPRHTLYLLPLAWALMTVSNSELLRHPLLAYKLKLTFFEGLSLTTLSTAINYVIPFKSGSGLRGLYLTSGRRLPITSYISMLFSVSAMTLTTASFFGLGGLLALWLRGHNPAPLLMFYFGGTALGGLGAALFLGRLPFRLPQRIKDLAQAWDSLRSTPGLWRRLCLWQVAYFLCWAMVNWLSLAAFSIHLKPSEAFFYTAGQIHATLINLTPGGLGFVEAFSAYAGQVLDFTSAEALSAQALSRLTAVAMLTVTGVLGWIYLTVLMGKNGVVLKKPKL
ncbi:MAG: flippase-like domain-containing protein [Deltaproteobacteria bacterium]|jgi:uncharacterized membrane protein YbhN (UPF0104 family)|nr:flippase-like domain-containing protein [Deltaproteobacteria bacterium]